MVPAVRLPAPSAINNHIGFVKKEDLENTVNTAVANAMNKLKTLISTSFTTPRNNMQMGLCHFCGEARHTSNTYAKGEHIEAQMAK